jgi:hypothetical protein
MRYEVPYDGVEFVQEAMANRIPAGTVVLLFDSYCERALCSCVCGVFRQIIFAVPTGQDEQARFQGIEVGALHFSQEGGIIQKRKPFILRNPRRVAIIAYTRI